MYEGFQVLLDTLVRGLVVGVELCFGGTAAPASYYESAIL